MGTIPPNEKQPEFEFDLKESFSPAVLIEEISENTIGEELRAAAKDSPDLLALIQIKEDGSRGKVWTYAELYADAVDLAKVLAAKHEKGSRIAVWAPNYPEWVLIEFGSALAGLVLVTVNPSYQVDELKYILEQSQSRELYVANSFRGNPMRSIAEKAVSEMKEEITLVDVQDWDQIFARGDHNIMVQNELPNVFPRDAAQIQYTSGTTGFPKGAKLHHQGLLNNAKSFQIRMSMKRGDNWLNCMPMFHTSGAGMATLGCLALRASHFIMERFDAKVWCQVVEREEINFLTAVPTMFVEILEEWRAGEFGVPKIKGMTSGGTNVPPSLVKEIKETFGVWIQIVYGQTETSPVISLAWSNDSLENLTNSVGQALPNVEVSIRDPQKKHVLPIGTTGEICCRGYNTMLEYHENDSATKETMDSNNWLYTGDLGSMDRQGYINVSGRVKEMIIRGGENIYPKEIENVLLENEAISEAAIVGIPDSKYGEIVGCFIKFEKDRHLSSEQLKKFIRAKISPQKTPAFWVEVDEWPLTGSGKIRKFVLREEYLKGTYPSLN